MKKIGEIDVEVAWFRIYYDEEEPYRKYHLFLDWYDNKWNRKRFGSFEKMSEVISELNWYGKYIDEAINDVKEGRVK